MKDWNTNFDYLEKDQHLLKVINEDGNVTGEMCTKAEVHDKKLWHIEAAVFLINSKGQILLHKRGDVVRFNKGKWAIPTNHVEINQTNIDSLIERVWDLHGIKLEENDFRYLFVQKRNEEQQKRYTYHYYVKLNIDIPHPKVNPAFATECKWYDFEELKKEMVIGSDNIVFKSTPVYINVFGALAKVIYSTQTHKQQQFVLLETADGVILPSCLYNPVQKTDKVAIFVHGSGANFYKTPYYAPIIEKLNNHNISFFSINNRGSEQYTRFYKTSNGKSEAYLGGTMYENFDESLFDISAAVEWAKDQGFKHITLIGQSLGTTKVTNYVEKIGGVDQIILVSVVDMINRFRSRVGKKYDSLIKKAKDFVKMGYPTEMITDEFSALKVATTMAPGSSGDIIQFEEGRSFTRQLSFKGKVAVICGTEDHVYKGFDLDYIHKCLEYQFCNATNLKFFIVNGANHMFAGYEKQLASHILEVLMS